MSRNLTKNNKKVVELFYTDTIPWVWLKVVNSHKLHIPSHFGRMMSPIEESNYAALCERKVQQRPLVVFVVWCVWGFFLSWSLLSCLRFRARKLEMDIGSYHTRLRIWNCVKFWLSSRTGGSVRLISYENRLPGISNRCLPYINC